MKKPDHSIGIGLIGCGRVADYGHLPAIAANPDWELRGLSDLNPEALERQASRYGVPGYADYHDLLAREEIDLVTICTRVDTHFEIASAALCAGKHVFCEKPMAATEEECETLARLAGEKGLLFGVNFELRVNDSIRAIREVLAGGELGKLHVVRFVHNWSCHGVNSSLWGGARRAKFMQEGGGALDCGIHFLDLARFLTGEEFQKVNVMGQWLEPDYRYPGHVTVQARMSNGAMALIEVSLAYTHTSLRQTHFFQYEAIGENGVVSAQEDTPLLQVTHGLPEVPPPPSLPDGERAGLVQIVTADRTELRTVGTGKAFAEVYAEWARAIRAGTLEGSWLATAEDGWQAARWMWRILAQADQERAEAGAVGRPLVGLHDS